MFPRCLGDATGVAGPAAGARVADDACATARAAATASARSGCGIGIARRSGAFAGTGARIATRLKFVADRAPEGCRARRDRGAGSGAAQGTGAAAILEGADGMRLFAHGFCLGPRQEPGPSARDRVQSDAAHD